MAGNQQESLDQVLDQALTSYVAQEPRTGIEQRVLARIRSEGAVRRFTWWRWALLAPAAACALLAVVLWPHQDLKKAAMMPATETAHTVTPVRTEPTEPVLKEVQAVRKHRPHLVAVVAKKPESLPKLDVFPTPEPMSPQMQALAAYVEQHPRQAQETLANEPTKIVIAPIQIAAIEIKPLVKLQDEAEIQKAGRRE